MSYINNSFSSNIEGKSSKIIIVSKNRIESAKDRVNYITLKEGDRVVVSVKNTNQTIAQSLKNFFYRLTGNDTYQIFAEHAGIVTTNGSNL